jgi:phage terminase large subunit
VRQFRDVLSKWKLGKPFVSIRETDFTISFCNGSEIIFSGLDDEEKLLSLTDVSTIWIEESFQVEKNKLEQLNLRMRGSAPNQQLILSWNPISKHSYLYDFTVLNPPENSVYIHSTYRDNPFLDQEYIDAIDEMAVRNPAKYRIYGLGEWGIDTDGLVITNFRVEAFDPMELASRGLEHRCGMDVGWVDPTSICNTLYDRENKIIYVFEEFYKSGCQLEEIANAIKDMKINKTKIYIDASEPRVIQFLKNEGINADKCIKGNNSVKSGYMFLQDHLIIVDPKCENLIMEFENLSYKKSKLTGEFTEEFDDHRWTHGCDSLRYAYSDIYTNTKLKTFNKSLLSL